MTVMPKRRRPDQNTGRRAKTVQHVETAPCPTGGLHRLTNVSGVTVCGGCGETWAELDAELRGAS